MVIYIVSSNLLDVVKIGICRYNIDSLYSRYITCYGKNTHIDYFIKVNVKEITDEKVLDNDDNLSTISDIETEINNNNYIELQQTILSLENQVKMLTELLSNKL